MTPEQRRVLTVWQELLVAMPDHAIRRRDLLARLPQHVNQATAGNELTFLPSWRYATQPFRGMYQITERGIEMRAGLLKVAGRRALAAAEGEE